MTTVSQASLIRHSFFGFVTRHIPAADLSVVDDIVMSYVEAVLEDASQDPVFDVEGFIEMMSAYFPSFSGIDSAKVCSWIFELASQLGQENNSKGSNKNMNISLCSLSLNDIIPQGPPCKQRVSRISLSEHSDGGSHSDGDSSGGPEGSTESLYSEECDALHEMFPDACHNEIRHCVTVACGDMDRATQLLLHRQETGQSLQGGPLNISASRHCPPAIDDSELKNRIISRYSYVDKVSDTREHRPLAPKNEPKKLVRYRDNKIVSLKGERYTEVSRVEGEEPKKPRRPHCP